MHMMELNILAIHLIKAVTAKVKIWGYHLRKPIGLLSTLKKTWVFVSSHRLLIASLGNYLRMTSYMFCSLQPYKKIPWKATC